MSCPLASCGTTARSTRPDCPVPAAERRLEQRRTLDEIHRDARIAYIVDHRDPRDRRRLEDGPVGRVR